MISTLKQIMVLKSFRSQELSLPSIKTINSKFQSLSLHFRMTAFQTLPEQEALSTGRDSLTHTYTLPLRYMLRIISLASNSKIFMLKWLIQMILYLSSLPLFSAQWEAKPTMLVQSIKTWGLCSSSMSSNCKIVRILSEYLLTKPKTPNLATYS